MSFALPVLNMRAEGTNPPPKLSDFVLFFSVGILRRNARRESGGSSDDGYALYECFSVHNRSIFAYNIVKSQDFLRNSHSLNLSEYFAGTRASTSTPPSAYFCDATDASECSSASWAY